MTRPRCRSPNASWRSPRSCSLTRRVLGYLSREEINALLAAPDRGTWNGRRDAIMLATMYNTGARVSEITTLRVCDILLDRQLAVHLHGKGRRERVIPLWKSTARQLRTWLQEIDNDPGAPVFPNRAGKPLARSGVRDRLDRAVSKAAQRCPTLHNRGISPHTIRHTCAMHLLQSGVDLAVIALWLGDADPATTHQYLEADLATKEAALRRLDSPQQPTTRYRPPRPASRLPRQPLTCVMRSSTAPAARHDRSPANYCT